MSSTKPHKSARSKVQAKMGNQISKITDYFKSSTSPKIKTKNLGDLSDNDSDLESDKPPICPSTSGIKKQENKQDNAKCIKESENDKSTKGITSAKQYMKNGAEKEEEQDNESTLPIEQNSESTLPVEEISGCDVGTDENAKVSTDLQCKTSESRGAGEIKTDECEEAMDFDYEGDSQEMLYHKDKKIKENHNSNTDDRKSSNGGSSDEYSEKWDRPWRTEKTHNRKDERVAKKLQSKTKKKFPVAKRPRLFRSYSDRDTEEYRKGYPGKKDVKSLRDNYLFYTNAIQSKPNGDYVDEIHRKWWGNYDRLEIHHQYIQWLFPIRESGLNWHAQELQLHEAKDIQKNPQAHARLLKSYQMMLDFYGMRLVDDKVGTIKRAENWKPRFRHLNKSMHNYLRITRILKCLGEMGYEHMKMPFIEFVLREALEEGTLPNVLDSCVNYWIGTIKNDKDRDTLRSLADYIDDDY